MWGMLLLMIFILFLELKAYNFSFEPNLYMECKPTLGATDCLNPIYDTKDMKYCKADWCRSERINPGVYGVHPPKDPIYNYYPTICILLMALGLFLNHIIHNRGKKFKLSVNLPDSLKDKIKNKINEVDKDD